MGYSAVFSGFDIVHGFRGSDPGFRVGVIDGGLYAESTVLRE
jgi:hypothetical protein